MRLAVSLSLLCIFPGFLHGIIDSQRERLDVWSLRLFYCMHCLEMYEESTIRYEEKKHRKPERERQTDEDREREKGVWWNRCNKDSKKHGANSRKPYEAPSVYTFEEERRKPAYFKALFLFFIFYFLHFSLSLSLSFRYCTCIHANRQFLPFLH